MVKRISSLFVLASILMLSFNSYSQDSVEEPAEDKRITICILDGSEKCKKPGSGCSKVEGCPGLIEWLGFAKDVAETVEEVKKIIEL